MNIIRNTATGGVAFTEKNCPGFDSDNPANADQLKAHTKVMNERAVALGIKARYETATHA